MNKIYGPGSPVLHTKAYGNSCTGSKEDFKAFYHIWVLKPSGHVTNIILLCFHLLVPKNLNKIWSKKASGCNSFKHIHSSYFFL